MFTIKHAAARLGVSEYTVRALCTAKRLRHVRIGLGRGKILIPEEAIAEFVATNTVGAAAFVPSPPPTPVPQAPKLRHLRLPS